MKFSQALCKHDSFSLNIKCCPDVPVVVVVHHIEPVIGLNQSRKVVTNLKNHNLNALFVISNENHDIAIAMSSSRADPVMGLYIYSSQLPWLGVFKYINQCRTAQAGGI